MYIEKLLYEPKIYRATVVVTFSFFEEPYKIFERNNYRTT